MTPECNWTHLLQDLESDTLDHDTITYLKQLFAKTTPLCYNLLANVYHQTRHRQTKTVPTYQKLVQKPKDICTKSQAIYAYIVRECPTDEAIMFIKNFIEEGCMTMSKKISGRTIDTLVTRFPKYHNVCYYIDATDPDHTFIVADDVKHDPARNIILFNIGASYRKKMQQYSKTFFDCFARGKEVAHQLQSGKTINISLCQFMFFIWATKFKVFEFLADRLDDIVSVRQLNNKKKKHLKRKQFSKTFICPQQQQHTSAQQVPIKKKYHLVASVRNEVCPILVAPPSLHDFISKKRTVSPTARC